MHNLNVPKTNVILTLFKICCCNESIDNVVATCKRNVTMTKIKCNPDVPQKALSERSHFLCYESEPEIT